MRRPNDLASTVSIVGAIIAEASGRGDGAGLFALGRRLEAVTGDPAPPSTRREIEQARIELEREFWVAAIG